MSGPVTTRYGGATAKPFAWSYSKVKNFEICPKRHYEIDIAKNWPDKDDGDPNSPLAYGNRVHDAMRDRLRDDTLLPVEMIDYEFFAKIVIGKARLPGAKLEVEQKYAVTREFGPCGYFASNVWYRGIADALVLIPVPGTDLMVAWVIDWKTGKFKDEPVQLALMAQCIFSHYPKVVKVRAIYYWLKEHTETAEDFTRSDMVKFWPSMLRRVSVLEEAARTMTYPPTHNPFCKKNCPVQACPFYGKAFTRS